MPIDYSQYLNANQRGLDTLSQTRLATLNQPTRIQSFMEGLRSGQDRTIAAQKLKFAQDNTLALQRQKADEITRKTADDETDWLKSAGVAISNSPNPQATAQVYGMFKPQHADKLKELASGFSVPSGHGSAYNLKERGVTSGEGYKTQLGSESEARAKAISDKLQPQIDLLKAQAELASHNAQRPFNITVNTGDKANTPGSAEWKRVKDVEFRAANAKGNIKDIDTVNAMLDDVEKLIKIAPGSYMDAGKSATFGALGISTEASKATAGLKALQASLMMKMPRMEGPQSDRDVELYREQAGRIADPTVPAGDKLAALQIIRSVINKYKNQKKTLSKAVFDRLTPAAQKMHLASGGVVK